MNILTKIKDFCKKHSTLVKVIVILVVLLIVGLIINAKYGETIKRVTKVVKTELSKEATPNAMTSKEVVQTEQVEMDNKDPENVKYYYNSQYDVIPLDDIDLDTDKPLSNDLSTTIIQKGEVKNVTYGELADIISEYLELQFVDYNLTENLVYNYTRNSETNSIGIYLTEDANEKRLQDQYYRDVKTQNGTKNFFRDIEAVKYKNKANQDIQRGEFSTRERNKKVALEWKDSEDLSEEEIERCRDLLIENREWDFSGLTQFYYFNDINDFKAKGSVSLKKFLGWLTITNDGTETLKDVSATITRDVVKNGVTTQEKLKIKPLQNINVDYTITKKDNIITLKIDATDSIKQYYKFWDKYDIIDCKYNMVIENIESEDAEVATLSDAIFNEEYYKMKQEQEAQKAEETKSSKKKTSKKTSTED